MDNNDWPLIEFVAPSQGILAKFTPSTSEAVANILIRELVHRVDRPSPSDVNAFSNDHELEWIMQVINHGLTLPFTSNESYETLRSAVRIYLAYLSALTNTPHHCCPKQLLIQPDRYFRKILEAFRRIFENRCPPSGDTSLLLQLSRQATQIGTILQAIMKLATSVMEEFRDEVWPRSLLFLINAADQIMSIEKCKTQESIGFLMAADLSDILFGCLTGAALAELIPSPSYWRTLSVLSWKCGHQVQFIESWAKTLLNSTIVLLHNLYGQPAYPLCDDNQTFEPFLTNPVTADKLRLFKDLWHNLFILLGNPSEFLKYGISQCEISINDRNNFNFFAEQLALSFFLTILAFKKMIDLFLGDFITIGFNESEELNCQWLESASATAGGMAPELDQQKRGSNTSINLSQQQMRNIRSQQQYFEAVPEKTAPSNEAPAQNFARDEIMAVRIAGRVRGGQHVWYILRSNTFKKASHLFSPLQTRPSASSLLAVFLDCLYESAALSMNNNNHNNTILQLSAKQSKNNAGASVMEDALSQKSTESGASLMDPCPTVGKAHHKQQEPDQLSQKFVTLRRSFANSISGSSTSNQESAQMVGGDHHNFSSPTEMPSVNGISSGRATAVGALCRIVCSKASRETFSDEQMARFFAILHEALLSRDRLVLCSLLYYSSDSLFKLAIRGVQILLPNYLMAIDIVLTESTKLPLHPSITPADMRASCLRALASLLPWPSVFGATHILGQKSPLGKSKQICRQGSSSNLLEPEMRYVDLCGHIQKMLVFSLRNETDPPNIQYSLALSTLFCAESAKYNLLDGSRECVERKAEKEGEAEENNGREKKREEYDRAKGSISLIRAVISAVCDNLCKPAWAKGTLCCLAAFDCLNCLSTIPHQILFHNGELSTGSLVVTSLCRFIDQQLRKPPPHHSRDMHSTVVAAYFCMDVWLTAAPCLSNIESCLSTVADTIELGMTGGHQLPTDQYKPASQRVHDAAQALLQSLFSNANKKTPTSSMAVNEIMLAQKFDLNLAQFQHYLINQSTLLSLHEAQHIHQLSKGLPTVICVFRTPFYEPWAGLIQLLPKAKSRKSNEGSREMGQQNDGQPSQQQPNELSPGCHSITNLGGMDESSKQQQQESETAQGNANAETNLTNGVGQKQFEIPPEVLQPQCQLDLRFPKLEPVPAEVEDIQSRLIQIRTRLSQRSGAPCGDRDSRNVWLNTSLGAILAKSPTPDSPAVHCNSLRVFLHDMGLINRNAYGSELIPLDSSSFDIFYDSLSVTVDQFSFRLNEQVSLFYAKEGQRTAEDILQNNINLRHTSANFCRLLSALGKAVGTRKTTVEASGDGTTRNKDSSIECFVLDGVDYYLRWRDSQMEIAFITPTGRIPVEESRKLAQKLQQQQQSLLLSSLRKTTTTPLLDVGHNQQQQQIYRSKSKSFASSTTGGGGIGRTQNMADFSDEKSPFPPGDDFDPSYQTIKSNRTMSCASTISNADHSATPKYAKRSTDLRILVVWLERLEDMDTFPLADLLPFTASGKKGQENTSHQEPLKLPSPNVDHIAFFLFQFERGLVRVQVDGVWTKYGQPGPLLDGTVVSMRALPELLKQTVCNIARRKAIEVENYQMTHLRRKQAIAEFGRRFGTRLSYTDFMEQFLLLNPTAETGQR